MTRGPLSIRPEGDGADVRKMFADQPIARTRVFSGAVIHILAGLLLLTVVRFLPKEVYETIVPDVPKDIVWIAQPGPSGGGGGGTRTPEPPKPQPKEPEPVAVPAVKQPEPPPIIPLEEPQAIVPSELLTAAPASDIGAIAPPSDSRGSGTGTGIGPGTGPGLGPGSGGGSGGDVYQPGNGVQSPILVRQVRPAYTADAMRARQQGTVDLDCVVLANGNVGTCEIVRSFKPPYGLDQEAIKAAQQWRFRPGTRQGQPVPVMVRIALDFHLR